jgi:hypothetical protein
VAQQTPVIRFIQNKQKYIGRKGVSKRKPKKSRPFSSTDINSSSHDRSNQRSPVQSLVKDKGAPLNRDGMNPSAGSTKSQKKR